MHRIFRVKAYEVELQNEINELKNIIRKANQMVPPPMKDMLPQDMKDAMNKVDQ